MLGLCTTVVKLPLKTTLALATIWRLTVVSHAFTLTSGVGGYRAALRHQRPLQLSAISSEARKEKQQRQSDSRDSVGRVSTADLLPCGGVEKAFLGKFRTNIEAGDLTTRVDAIRYGA